MGRHGRLAVSQADPFLTDVEVSAALELRQESLAAAGEGRMREYCWPRGGDHLAP